MSKKKKSEAWGENGFEDWGGYMAAKKAKLQEQFQNEADKEFKEASNLFQGIAIFVNGYTDPTADELRRYMMAHGGVYHHYMRPRITTHIIASNLPYSKIVLYRKSQNPIPICKPQWIVDSIKAGKVLNFQNYLLYSNSTETQPQLKYKITNEDKINSHLDTCSKEQTNSESTVSEFNTNNIDEISGKLMSHKSELIPIKLDNARNKARCSKDSEFLTEFYNHSRLHHISTMGATFKDYVNELRDKSIGVLHGLNRLKELKSLKENKVLIDADTTFSDEIFESEQDNRAELQQSTIMHIDMDCFFVSVGLRNKPELKGLPVAVTHAKGNKHTLPVSSDTAGGSVLDDDEPGSLSEVASCSYEARKAGVKNGMFLGDALKLCPNLKTITYDFEGYKEVSYKLYDTVASYTLDIEAVSCDELYADCTKILEESCLTPMEFATIIREEIKEKTCCPVSTGFGSNKLLARLATRKAKPDGQFYITKDEVEAYVGSFNVRDLPGVGGTTAQKLSNINVRTCAELQKVSLSVLQKDFGKKTGEMLYNMCRGIDNTKLNTEHVRKSVSAEVNYGIRFESNDDAVDFLKKLSAEVCNRLQKANAKGRCITLKAMVRAKQAPVEAPKFMGHGWCDYMTRSKNLIAPVDDVVIITKEILSLWHQLQLIPEDMRGIGIQISRLEISKHKSRNTCLSNFVDKAKHDLNVQRVESNNYTEIRPAKKIENTEKLAKPKDLRTFFTSKQPAQMKDKQYFHDSSNINAEVLAELPKYIQDEILGVKEKVSTISTSNNEKREDLICITDNNVHTNVPSGTKSQNNSSETSTLSNVTSELKHTVQSFNIDTRVVKQFQEDNSSQSRRDKAIPITSSIAKSLEPIQEFDETTACELQVADRSKGGIKKLSENKKRSEKTVQMHQESYFKHTKPSTSRSGKVEMPPLQEIDMSVLIELPEDVRNEILNEYRANKHNSDINTNKCENSVKEQVAQSSATTDPPVTSHQDDHDISFSQVDPEFLAALSDDLKRDVEMYCAVKKTERNAKVNKVVHEEVARGNTEKGSLAQKQNKKERLVKSKQSSRNTKPAGQNGKKKGVKGILKHSDRNDTESESHEKDGKRSLRQTSCSSMSKASVNRVTADEAEAILSYNRTILDTDETSSQHQEILIDLVNHLVNLPLEQVKMQIQTWINNSKVVNEVDFLSLATFLSMLPEKKRIEDLHILLKTMHRCMTKTGNCIWHKTYRKTVKHVQHYMQIEYNSNLMVPPIRCNLLQCNSDVT